MSVRGSPCSKCILRTMRFSAGLMRGVGDIGTDRGRVARDLRASTGRSGSIASSPPINAANNLGQYAPPHNSA